MENAEEEDLHLTINDYINLSGGLTLPYRAIATQPNVVQRGEIRVQEEIPENGATPKFHVTNENEILPDSLNGEPPQSLPPGKKYHVFFSHSNEDREWVLRMVNKLESPEYGFKCCFADRDFDLGAPVFQNITKCINLSKKTVIVLTPEFLQSPWCSYETRITIEMDLDTRQRLLVPVMLRNCRVPDFIGRLSYIDADNEHFWERFLQALRDDSSGWLFNEAVGSEAIIGGRPFDFNPRFFNADIISEVTVYSGGRCHSSDFMPNELMRPGLQLSANEYQEIVNTLCGIQYVRCHARCSKMFFCVLLFFQIWIYITIFIVIMSITHDYSTAFVLIPVCISTTAILCVLLSLTMMRTIKTLLEKTVAANKIAIRRNMMVSVKGYRDQVDRETQRTRVSIIFMYYDWQTCKSYLKTHLHEIMKPPTRDEQQVAIENDERDSLISPQTESLRMSQEELETYVENLLLHHATEYGNLVLTGRTRNPSEQRHTRQKECLCQFVESVLVENKTSCLDSLHGGPTRHPWLRIAKF